MRWQNVELSLLSSTADDFFPKNAYLKTTRVIEAKIPKNIVWGGIYALERGGTRLVSCPEGLAPWAQDDLWGN
jgi:hypothetical protein